MLPGEYFVHDEDLLIMTTLGSCIAACLWDRQRRIGGMNHFMLPEGGGSGADAGRYGGFAMELLINELIKRGATRATMEAKVFGGGAVIAGMNSINVGERNTELRARLPAHRAHHRRVARTCWTSTRARSASCPHSGKAMVKRLAATNTDALARAGARRRRQAVAGGVAGGFDRPVLRTDEHHEQDPRHRRRRFGPGARPAGRDHQPPARHGSASARPATRWWRAR